MDPIVRSRSAPVEEDIHAVITLRGAPKGYGLLVSQGGVSSLITNQRPHGIVTEKPARFSISIRELNSLDRKLKSAAVIAFSFLVGYFVRGLLG